MFTTLDSQTLKSNNINKFAWLLDWKDFIENAILISAKIEYGFEVFSSI